MTQPRIAVVQHGDYAEAVRIIGSGQPEPYSGMADSVTVLGRLLEGRPHLVISLNALPYTIRQGPGELVGLPCPTRPRGVPVTVRLLLWARQINRRIGQFRPTHVLLRTGGLVAYRVLRLCRGRGYNTLVMFANYLGHGGWAERWVNRRLIGLLNEPFVSRVGNHRPPATRSLLAHGLQPEKAIAYDWPGHEHPADHAPKRLGPPPHRIVYAGSLSEAKGIFELAEAVRQLIAAGDRVRLTILGDGPDASRLHEQVRSCPEGSVMLAGRVPNRDVFAAMRSADLVCVPSRHSFSEGMPMALTEALASRTPVVASDHPVFVATFRDGEGLRLFRAGDPDSLAGTIRAVLADPERYEALSLSTAEAHARIECPTTFGQVIEAWLSGVGTPAPTVASGREAGS